MRVLRQLLVLATVLCCASHLISFKVAAMEAIVLVHGGAGNIGDDELDAAKHGVKTAARRGYVTLLQSGNVLDAVQEAVRSLEADPEFNSGHGSVLTWEGTVQMDAAIMNGSNLNGGCVSLVRDIYHPVSLARAVMEKTRHRYLAGEGAMDLAVAEGFELLEEGALITEKSLKALEDYKNSLKPENESKQRFFGSQGTVGAVAIDEFGNLAAATSTGGITGKMSGRIGDSPILGGGTYADNAAGAISLTGHGETIMRYTAASRILAMVAYEGVSVQEATMRVLEQMNERFDQTAGVIGIDRSGEVGIYFTSKRMSWAYQRGDELHFGVDKDEDNVEIMGEPRVDTNWIEGQN